MSKIKTVRVPSAESFTIRNDLLARNLIPSQIEQVMHWIVQQQQSHVPVADVETYFQQAGFLQGECEAVLLTLYKESVRPWCLMFVLVIIAIICGIALLIGKL